MQKTELSKFQNQEYTPGNKVKLLIWYIINRLIFNTSIPYPIWIKQVILKLFGANIGSHVLLKPKVSIKYPWYLTIGSHVWIGENVWIDSLTNVEIGDNVCISQGAMLLCGNHNYKKSSFNLIVKEIKLEDGVWIGAKSVVCPGVTCKDHSILTVGSIAIKDLEPYSIYQGNPAVKIKDRTIVE